MNKTDLQALHLSGTYCHKTGTRPPSCGKPLQLTVHTYKILLIFSDQIFVNQPNYEKICHITANTIWGLLRGLESFSHLIYNTKEHGYQVGYSLITSQIFLHC